MSTVIVIACVAAIAAVLFAFDTDKRVANTDHAARMRLITELERADRR